jgi:hypothetical protein
LYNNNNNDNNNDNNKSITISSSENFVIADRFSESKRKILWYLKIMQEAGLEELANVMKMSRMGVH